MGPEALRQRLFTRTADLPPGVQRLPLKSIHVNKSPMVVGQLRTLRPELAERWGVDLALVQTHAERAAALPDMSAIWSEVFAREQRQETVVPEQDLYGGFVGPADRRRLDQLRALDPSDPGWRQTGFDDERLSDITFLYRACNFSASLTEEEQQRWQDIRVKRLMEGAAGSRTLEQLFERIDVLAEQACEAGNDRAQEILSALYDYAESIAPEI